MVRRLYPRTGLSTNQGDDIEDDVNTRMQEDFTGTINWLQFDSMATGQPDIYKEKKKKIYREAVELNAVVVLNPAPKILEDLGEVGQVDIMATVMNKQLQDKATTPNQWEITIKDLIEYKGVQYTISRVLGSGEMVYDKHLLTQVLGVKTPGAA